MFRFVLVCIALLCNSLLVQASTELWQLSGRVDEAGKPIGIKALVEVPEKPVQTVLLSFDVGSTKLVINEGGSYGLPMTLITRNRALLNAEGVAVVLVGPPADKPEGITVEWREGAEHRRDVKSIVDEVRKKFPNIPIYAHGYMEGASSILNLADAKTSGIEGYITTSGKFSRYRNESYSAIKARGLVMHPLSHRCLFAPMIEAREVAAVARWQFVAISDAQADRGFSCAPTQKIGVMGQDEVFVKQLTAWLRGEKLADEFGKTPTQLGYQESVMMVTGASRGLFGKNKIELSLLTPAGDGPFPLVVFNHGDILEGSSAITLKQRFVDHTLAAEFLGLGFAVAFPARPGIGRSDGMYKNFQGAGGVYIGPATGLLAKGREHLSEGLAAVEYLRSLPQIDGRRIVMAGQSAGGFAVSVLAAEETPPDWLIAVINFSGGRTDGKSTGLNEGMVSAFEWMGKTSRVPSLWIFAENDSRYSAETIRASFAAFKKSGGNVQMELYPPSQGDGHYISQEPERWRKAARAFLSAQGLLGADGKVLPMKTP